MRMQGFQGLGVARVDRSLAAVRMLTTAESGITDRPRFTAEQVGGFLLEGIRGGVGGCDRAQTDERTKQAGESGKQGGTQGDSHERLDDNFTRKVHSRTSRGARSESGDGSRISDKRSTGALLGSMAQWWRPFQKPRVIQMPA